MCRMDEEYAYICNIGWYSGFTVLQFCGMLSMQNVTIMFKSTELVIAKGCGGKVDYENPEFRMMINAAAGGPLRSMQISSGMKGGVFPGLLEMANGHFFKGLWKRITG